MGQDIDPKYYSRTVNTILAATLDSLNSILNGKNVQFVMYPDEEQAPDFLQRSIGADGKLIKEKLLQNCDIVTTVPLLQKDVNTEFIKHGIPNAQFTVTIRQSGMPRQTLCVFVTDIRDHAVVKECADRVSNILAIAGEEPHQFANRAKKEGARLCTVDLPRWFYDMTTQSHVLTSAHTAVMHADGEGVTLYFTDMDKRRILEELQAARLICSPGAERYAKRRGREMESMIIRLSDKVKPCVVYDRNAPDCYIENNGKSVVIHQGPDKEVLDPLSAEFQPKLYRTIDAYGFPAHAESPEKRIMEPAAAAPERSERETVMRSSLVKFLAFREENRESIPEVDLKEMCRLTGDDFCNRFADYVGAGVYRNPAIEDSIRKKCRESSAVRMLAAMPEQEKETAITGFEESAKAAGPIFEIHEAEPEDILAKVREEYLEQDLVFDHAEDAEPAVTQEPAQSLE